MNFVDIMVIFVDKASVFVDILVKFVDIGIYHAPFESIEWKITPMVNQTVKNYLKKLMHKTFCYSNEIFH
ncbi:hypothetical protein CN601_08960 [Bacillus sp. AFS017336]|nr:hypothetical protein CN601_08960 [Bacillus sp. AFS017336]